MKNRVLLKIELRNKGIKVLPKSYLSTNSVICSFSLPKILMKKFKKLRALYTTHQGDKLICDLLNNFKFKETDLRKIIYNWEFEKYIADNNIILSKSYKHSDYKFSSLIIKPSTFETLKKISEYYGISRSSLIRILVEMFDFMKFQTRLSD